MGMGKFGANDTVAFLWPGWQMLVVGQLKTENNDLSLSYNLQGSSCLSVMKYDMDLADTGFGVGYSQVEREPFVGEANRTSIELRGLRKLGADEVLTWSTDDCLFCCLMQNNVTAASKL